jgi:hypothetical protein
MRKLNRLFTCLFLLPLFTLAQSNFKPGYVVTIKGDTLKGFIDYRGWDSNPDAISFKATADGHDVKRNTVNDIDFFEIAGVESYRKGTCSVSKDITDLTRLSSARDTSFDIKTVFLKVLQKGKNVTLYSFTDEVKTRYYLGEAPDFKPLELVYRVYQNSNEGRTVYESDYRRYLLAAANKYDPGDDNFALTTEAGYTSSDLLKVVSKINHISKAEFEKRYNEKSAFNLFVGAGVNIGSTSSSSASSYSTGGGIPYTSYLPEFSVGLNMIPKPESDKVEFRVELLYAQTKFNVSYQLKVSPYIAMSAAYDQSAVYIMPQILYNFYNADNFKLYIGGGIDFSFFSYSNSHFGSKVPGVSDNGISETDPFAFNSTDNSFLLKVGAKLHKKWGIYFNYIASTASTTGGYFGLSNSSKQLGLLYFFGN